MSLLLDDGSLLAVHALTLNQVMSDMTLFKFKPTLNRIKELQQLEVPKEFSGKIYMILGLGYNNIYPEVIHTLPNGLQILKSKSLPAMKGEVCCIGGPLESFHYMSHLQVKDRLIPKHEILETY